MLTYNFKSRPADEHPELLANGNNVLQEHDRQYLLSDLERAVTLGNLYNESTIIEYEDKMGVAKRQESIVIAATELYAILRGGESIPIERITRVTT